MNERKLPKDLDLNTVICRAMPVTAYCEGLKLKAYRATPAETYLTIGYGHHVPSIKAGDTIDELGAFLLLDADLKYAFKMVCALVKVPLDIGQAAALSDFVFNLGAGWLQRSTLLKLLNAGKYENAKQELKKFVYQGGTKMNGLVMRRELERRLWEGEIVKPKGVNLPL